MIKLRASLMFNRDGQHCLPAWSRADVTHDVHQNSRHGVVIVEFVSQKSERERIYNN